MIEDKNCNNETLYDMVINLINNKELLSNLSYNAQKNAQSDSSKKIIEQLNSAMGINNEDC
jgi:UDP-N-acetylglucosamine:LPS N-acetylglucosamine transferase